MTRTYYEARCVSEHDVGGEYTVVKDEEGDEIYGDDEAEVTDRAKEVFNPSPGWLLVIAKIDVTYRVVP